MLFVGEFEFVTLLHLPLLSSGSSVATAWTLACVLKTNRNTYRYARGRGPRQKVLFYFFINPWGKDGKALSPRESPPP